MLFHVAAPSLTFLPQTHTVTAHTPCSLSSLSLPLLPLCFLLHFLFSFRLLRAFFDCPFISQRFRVSFLLLLLPDVAAPVVVVVVGIAAAALCFVLFVCLALSRFLLVFRAN